MCLYKVEKVYKRRSNKVVTAYKVLDYDQENYHFPYVYFHDSSVCPTGKWIKAEEKAVIARGGKLYHSGFHCYKYKNTAYSISNKIVKVKLRRVHTIGIQDGVTVLVAEEMFVPKRRAKNEGKRSNRKN